MLAEARLGLLDLCPRGGKIANELKRHI